MNLTLQTLAVLRDLDGNLIREDQLRTDLRATVTPAPTGSEISTALNTIEKHQWAVSVRDAITGDIRWRITDAGRAELAARNL